MVIKSVQLETVCGITSKLPDNMLPEIAFAGKSNVGKSSLINGIMNRKILFGVECHNLFDTDEMTNFNYPLAGRTIMAKIRFTTLKW